MKVVLFRHGVAASREEWTASDSERPLTREGVAKTTVAARGLTAVGLVVRGVFTSPYARAAHTAELVAAALRLPRSGVETTNALLPDAPLDELFDLVAAAQAPAIVCVGHAPHLDRFLARALGSTRDEVTTLKKAGAACLEGAAGRWSLEWVLPPRVLRALAPSVDRDGP